MVMSSDLFWTLWMWILTDWKQKSSYKTQDVHLSLAWPPADYRWWFQSQGCVFWGNCRLFCADRSWTRQLLLHQTRPWFSKTPQRCKHHIGRLPPTGGKAFSTSECSQLRIQTPQQLLHHCFLDSFFWEFTILWQHSTNAMRVRRESSSGRLIKGGEAAGGRGERLEGLEQTAGKEQSSMRKARLSWQSSPRSAEAHSHKINLSCFCFCFFSRWITSRL